MRSTKMLSPMGGRSYLEYALRVIEGRYTIISNASASGHAGGPRKAAIAADLCTESAGANSTTVAAASDDDDGDGDGDPDSDRRKTHQSKSAPPSQNLHTVASRRILRMPAVKVRVGLSRTTIYDLMNRREFPASISLGSRAIGFLESDIEAWIDSRIAASRA